VYDINTNLCCFLRSVDDEPGANWYWYPLDMALLHYWEKIELGKLVLDPAKAEWSIVPYSEESELHPTLLSWDAYVDMIIERLSKEQRKTAAALEMSLVGSPSRRWINIKLPAFLAHLCSGRASRFRSSIMSPRTPVF